MFKKRIALLLALIMLFSVWAVPQANAASALLLEAGDVEATLEAGTVSVPVKLTRNAGYAYGFVSVGWDKTVLTLESIEYTDLAPKQSDAAAITNSGSYTVAFGNDMAEDNFEGTGTAFTLVFTYAPTVPAGDYSISLSNPDVYDKDIIAVSTIATGCIITLAEELPEDTHTPAAAVKENEVAATCTEAGSYESVVYCSGCGEELSRETVNVPALGHNHLVSIVAPTCTDQGYTSYTCSRCGDNYKRNYEEPLGHDFGEWHLAAEAVEATCTETGLTAVEKRTCSRCNTSEKRGGETVAKKAHRLQSEVTAPTCTHKGYTVYTCADCGYSYTADFTERTEHTYTVIVHEPTTESQGYTVYVCTGCGYAYVSDITDMLPGAIHYIVPKLDEITATITMKSDTAAYDITAADGVFTLTDVKSDVYRVYAKQKNSLTVSLGEYDTKLGEVTNNDDIILPRGDVNGDDVIDIADLSMLLATGNYGQANTEIDLTGDGFITIDDIAEALQAHAYGKSSAKVV